MTEWKRQNLLRLRRSLVRELAKLEREADTQPKAWLWATDRRAQILIVDRCLVASGLLN